MKENKLAEAMECLDEKYINEAEQYRRKAKKRPVGFLSVTAMAACLVLVMGLGMLKPKNETVRDGAVISIDVNPSIEVTVNKKDKVVSAVALNEDAEIVLADMDLKHVDLDVALNAIMGSLLKNGYLDEVYNAINICVEDKDTDRANLLGERVSAEISNIFEQKDLLGEVNMQYYAGDAETRKLAQQYKVSVGKLGLAQQVASGMNLPLEEALELSVSELWDLMEANGVPLLSKEGALGIAIKDAGASENELTDVSQKIQETAGIYTYLISFTVGGNRKYEYRINAVSGTIITCEFSYNVKKEETEATPTKPPVIPSKGTPPVRPEATPTPVPDVTPTGAPGVMPEATPTPVPDVTPEATPTAAPGVTTEATLTPVPEATPTSVPGVTPTPAPSATPESTKPPKVTKEPKPTKVPLPVKEEKPKKEYTKKEALALVYQDAGVQEKDAKLTKLQHMPKEKQYHIEFSVGLCDYSYTISAVDGTVIKKEIIDHSETGETTGPAWTEETVLELVLEKSGVTFAELTKCEIKYHAKKDGGEYKIHFHVDKDHYEYSVDAVTGEITEKKGQGPATPEKPVTSQEKAKEGKNK